MSFVRNQQPSFHRTPFARVLLLLWFTSPFTLRAQDIHFSQIDVNPILLNPAYSGFFDGTGRAGLCYRNQWSSVSKAFQTVAATFEISLLRRRYERDGLSVGFIISSDRAGTLHYGTTSGNVILSYYRALAGNNNNFISLAVEAGAGQAGFNPADIEMEDPTEPIENSTTGFFTVGAGGAWFYQPNDEFYLKIGVAGRNLNRPSISYTDIDDAFIEPRYSLYTRAEYRMWPNVALLPVAACMFQRNYREILFGGDAKWYLSESSFRQVAFSAGIHYRWRDAATVNLTAEYNAFLFALSYDANLSKLTPASKSIGAFEIGIIYRLAKSRRIHRKAMPCPII